eukprot:TRINITY_DN60570_c0_g2_i2.p1 TRINITY_DN60570_c0_g2~~TRINITY_DN60570_c0_g2_i2.p1  ORF type:complete len:129 (-),score=18.73 TRINITY_DN60570_c0_g2_i2:50-436(-)
MGINLSKKDNIESKHCVPLGLYPSCNWDNKTIKKLILEKKLAPIFDGIEENENNEPLDECPICFYFYPYLNKSSCCKQPICTECYMQIKGTPKNEGSCPYCNNEGFNVDYCGAKSTEEREQEEQVREI